MNHIIRGMVTAALLSLIGVVAHAQQAVELQQNAQDALRAEFYADDYYNGGYGGNSTTSGPVVSASFGPGPALGFTFSTNAAVLLPGTQSSQGRFENLPTDAAPGDGNTQVLNFNNTSTSITNVINFAAGFTGLTFNYSLGNNSSAYDQTADVWSGLNGTGSIVGTISLGVGTLQSTQALNSATTTITPSSHLDIFTAWSSATDNSLSGIGESVTFGTSTTLANQELELDAFTVESVPEPSSCALGITAVALFFVLRRRALRA